ncbi:FecR domain-containing protein [Sulfitobacter aestuariivivens]|uniref:FecR domain-containing protein n=1 Tax=Sulfitobacter aestuariivivens TaxID=2766981 RepID=A0A927CZR6_9RHOB|nr:FecR domain-containing protein [Sulfitobacter aestuariivivens]MBD3662418.1 FecR domain-containing protein [Sulfitobacter aestuariivivens]
MTLSKRALFRVRSAAIAAFAVLCASALYAQSRSDLDAPLEVVVFQENDTLRGVVETHLKDPDLWPYVLELNAITSPADVVPNTELRLPIKQVRAADAALAASLEAIQKANAEGAQVFAPIQISAAIENREGAVEKRSIGSWVEVVDLSDIATVLALEALEISIAQRDRSAEAVVSDVHGRVEGRSPKEARWTGRDQNDVLVEFERVRTLSGSTTQVTFRDLSRLRLNANSNATIQRMRADPLTGDEVTKVSLVNGDFYALLNQLSDKTSFEVEVPGLETKTNSSDFWIKNDVTGARFVNYDTPVLEVSDGNQVIEVAEDEGVLLSNGEVEKSEILNSPSLIEPTASSIMYDGTAPLTWSSFEGAEGYWVEVAADAGFNQMQISEWGLRDTRFDTPQLAPRTYHWRVAALDRLGLPGQWSTARSFEVRTDNAPPFLTLLGPANGVIVSTPTTEIFGISEPLATVALNETPVVLGDDGSFIFETPLQPGENVLVLKAVDPAGNESTLTQTVVYRPTAQIEITLDADLPRDGDALATRSEELPVFAQSTAAPGATVIVSADGQEPLQTRVDADGAISFSVPVTTSPHAFKIAVLSPTGAVEGTVDFLAVRDEVPPQITLDVPPPRATDLDEILLEGSVDGAQTLTVNGQDIVLSNGSFAHALAIVPGANIIDIVATDAVGNVQKTRVQTLYDVDPPEILSVDLGRPEGDGGPIEITLRASDESGLRQAASFVLRIGDTEREGFLRCETEAGICRASLPPEPGQLRLIEVVVEDYAGNVSLQ